MNLINYISQYHSRFFLSKLLLNKEFFLGLFLVVFSLGMTTGIAYQSYNDFRVFQIILLLLLCIGSWFNKQDITTNFDTIFLSFIAVGALFWQHWEFIIAELLLVYLLYKTFQVSTYQKLVAKLVVLLSLSMFLLLPFSIWGYLNTGVYYPNWYPLSLNIRVYDSYFLLISVFAVWFCLTEKKHKYFHLLFIFLAFLAFLLDGGRSATIAYTVFVAVVSIAYRSIRWQLILMYVASWLTYLSITYHASSSQSSVLKVLRTSTSGRSDLLTNAYQCWLQSPIIGCGFYQLDNYRNLSAHPHNLYIQVLSETGVIGFGLLLFAIAIVVSRINWRQRNSYFVIAALIAIGIDSAFSGVYVYPITQMAILWLLIFLLKSSGFSHSQYFNYLRAPEMVTRRYLSLTIYLIIAIIYFYIFITTSALTDTTMSTPPRFWIDGYSLL